MTTPKFLRSLSIFALGFLTAAAVAVLAINARTDTSTDVPAEETVAAADTTEPGQTETSSGPAAAPEEESAPAPAPEPAPGGTPVAVAPEQLPADAETALADTPIYFNDFADSADADRIDSFVHYRDPFVVNHTGGSSDHAPGDGAACTGPDATRPQTRERPRDHVYLCHPGGDPAKGHMMGFAMDTTGYGFVGGLPDQVFEGVREVSVDVNATNAGFRNFVEIKVLPASQTFVNAMPCGPDLPCNAGWDYDDVNGVGVTFASSLAINTPDRPDGHRFHHINPTIDSNGDIHYQRCDSAEVCFSIVPHATNRDIRVRWQHIFRDNGDGTISFGIREENQTSWVTAPGSFPDGPVRVVVAFHNYTGTKSGQGPGFEGNDSLSTGGFTWHWDNLAVVADRAVPSEEFYGGVSAASIVAPVGCISFSQGQRDTEHHTDIAPQFACAT